MRKELQILYCNSIFYKNSIIEKKENFIILGNKVKYNIYIKK